MNRLRISAAWIVLLTLPLASSAALAEDDKQEPSAVDALRTEPGLWSAYADDDSSLLTQATAVFADLRAKHGVEAEPLIAPKNVQVVAMNDDSVRHLRTGNGSEGCKFMEIPGSRIREWRCYFPNEGEKALNEYQFREEIRMNIRQTSYEQMRRMSTDVFIQETMQNPSMFQR
jgi:hypothetical protein